MKVLLKNAQNQIIVALEVDAFMTVRELRRTIARLVGVDERLQRLLFRGHQIEDEHLISQLARLDFPRCLATMTESQKRSIDEIRKMLKCEVCGMRNCSTEYVLSDYRIADEKTIVLLQRPNERNNDSSVVAIAGSDKLVQHTNDSRGSLQIATLAHV